MKKIALFCEGVTENRIISYITERYLGDEIIVDGIYPDVIELNNKIIQNGYGGWKTVLDHCNEKDIDSALDGHDYLIIQIDTDTCNQVNYDVDTNENGKKASDETIYDRVVERLLKNISEQKKIEYQNRIIFAICFNETECWLLPIYYHNNDINKCKKTNACIFTLNQRLQSQGLSLPDKNKNVPNAIKTYNTILKNLKPKNIPIYSSYNVGFKHFVEQLDEIKKDIG